MRAQPMTLVTVCLFVVAGIGYIVFPPFYEDGLGKFIVPLLGTTDLIAAYALIKNNAKLKRFSRPYAVGTLFIAIPFWGESSEYYGKLLNPMLVVETSVILACSALLLISFTKGFYAAPQSG